MVNGDPEVHPRFARLAKDELPEAASSQFVYCQQAMEVAGCFKGVVTKPDSVFFFERGIPAGL